MVCQILGFVILISVVSANLLENAGFENPNSVYPWECLSCQASSFRDMYEGYWSVLVSRRGQSFSALTQSIKLNSTGEENFIFKCHIKLLNAPKDKAYAHVHVYVNYIDRSGKYIKNRFVDLPKQQVAFDWIELGGDFHIPQGIFGQKFNVSIELPDDDVDYVVDDATLVVLPTNSNWRASAATNIDRLRKATLTLTPVTHHNSNYYCSKYGGSYCIDISNMFIEIKQTRSQYAFGSNVSPEYLTGNKASSRYSQFVEKNFEWAIVKEILNWDTLEPESGVLSNDSLDLNDTLQYLRSHRIKTWGSGLFSALTEENPTWLKRLPQREVIASIKNRIDTLATQFGGKFDNLDVYRDQLQDDFLEIVSQSPNISQELFRWARPKFTSEKLLLNEQNVLNDSLHTTAYANMAKRFNVSHIPVDGMGIMALFNTSNVDIDVLKYRLDKLSEAGYPLWISRLIIINNDVTVRSKILDDVMTLLYSRPDIKGIILDGVWDGSSLTPYSALADGANFVMNAAGQVYINRWHTHETQSFTHTIRPRVYKGEYDIIIREGRYGSAIYTRHITVGDSGQSLTIHVTGQGRNYHVSNFIFG